MINSKQLGRIIRRARKKKGLSQAQLANMTGLARNTIANTERGDRCPTWDTAVAIINTLGITSAQLEGGKDGA